MRTSFETAFLNLRLVLNMDVSVLVPTYGRPRDLARCLGALALQLHRACEVIVVVRAGDCESTEVARAGKADLPIEIVSVARSGQVQALNAGLARCRAEIVAITDDDAAPRPDWLLRIESHFAGDKMLGGVGGRDWVHHGDGVDGGSNVLVGRFLWFGRAVGNHHIGKGRARDVDFLKGVNCAFRMAAIRPIGFDERLRGAGAQVHNDMVACLLVKRAGWRILYDPAVAVDHYPAPRHDRDQRHKYDEIATADAAHNFRLALAELSPVWKRLTALAWHYFVGTRDAPGVVNLLRMLANREPDALDRYRAALWIFLRPGKMG